LSLDGFIGDLSHADIGTAKHITAGAAGQFGADLAPHLHQSVAKLAVAAHVLRHPFRHCGK
jgi:hypothetical protein